MELAGYAVSLVREGDFTLSRCSGNGLMPILLLTANDTSLASRKRLEHEYALRAELDSAWAARPLELSEQSGRATLVLKDPGGEPLDQLLDGPLAIANALHIAISFAHALGQMHAHGIVHKDIKPANVLVDASTGRVWLTGFGMASHIPRELPNPDPPQVIAGTLAYMAPEQTGRMNRSIDLRSDLYSFGVTLYELITGALPFSASDPMEWIHCHIARVPLSLSERVSTVPAQLSAIVMKLLAKTGEERYQTAAGIEADLRQCLASWESHGCIDAFTLGAHDVSERLLMPEQLYGREREIQTLLAAFERVVAHNTRELVLVSGYAGVGKSSVVNELHKALVPPRGLFVSGKFDQYKRDIPYATLAQAFQILIRGILVKPDAELDQWRHALQESVGPNGQLIVNLIPVVELIIGRQPPVPDLPPQDAQNRFQMVLRSFLGAFARPEHPLLLFLDDLQWLDSATLDLLQALITDANLHHFMLVGAYRDNEVSPSHPLMRTLETIRENGAKVQEIVLAPLLLGDVAQLIGDALHCERDAAYPLAQLVHEKTGGNPFFAIQFLMTLAEEGLVAFDREARGWSWDLARIRAKGYTDNVVDLMVAKIQRLPDVAQDALRQLACLGNVVDIATLTIVQGKSDEAIHRALWEAVHAGLVFRQDGAYKFLHDRIQQAAYSLIPEERRAEVHLRIGRAMIASMTADELADHLFDVANQLNRGGARVTDRDEKVRVATIDLRAGQKAKASAAYASARLYLAAGMALLDNTHWSDQYHLMFNLRLDRAECELLTGNFDTAEQLIGELLQRGASKVDLASAYHLKILLDTLKSEHVQAVNSALTCLRLFGIDIATYPTSDDVRTEYETLWQSLNGRPIESLIDLPLMTDSELQAAMQVLATVLGGPAYFTDANLFCLLSYRLVNLSIQRGVCGASVYGCACLAAVLDSFHRYDEGYRFAKLACDLVDKHGFIAYRAMAYMRMGQTALWTQPIATGIDFSRAAFRAAIETGDLRSACYSMLISVMCLRVRNDPLDAVWRESETGFDFARRAGFRDIADAILSQQRFIANMQGRTATFSTFSDAQFDEAAFEAELTGNRNAVTVYFYWLLKLKARFISGDYTDALVAVDKAKAVLWVATPLINFAEYVFYTALTLAALFDKASEDEQTAWRELLTAHREQLREWADIYPPTFADKYTLVMAELARLEGRDVEAMRLYEEAIALARESGFVQFEGLTHEIAAEFCTRRGFTTARNAHLKAARTCYAHWGALGKVRQLDQRDPGLGREPVASATAATIDARVEQLDVGTVVKASQAVSGEIELEKLIETLMRIALEHAGAERGVLFLFPRDELQIAAEATTSRGSLEVTLWPSAVTPDLPESVLQYVLRTRESVTLDDASASTLFSTDNYIQQRRPRSVICIPLIKQTKLVGALYLENTLTPRAFTSDRTALLQLVASQAAISLENATLYDDLRRNEGFLAEGQRISHTGTFAWTPSTGRVVWTDECYRIFEFDRAVSMTLDMVLRRAHPEDLSFVQRRIERVSSNGIGYDEEYRLQMPDGRIKYVHVVGLPVKDQTGHLEFIGTVQDITAAKRADEELHKAHAALADVTRITTLGELAASIAHEVNQPLTSMVSNAEACRRWLNRSIPDLDEARTALESIVGDGHRAAAVTRRVRALLNKTETPKAPLVINHVVNELIALVQHELASRRVSMRTELADTLPQVNGDRIQLQQVLINLVMNGIEAMQSVKDRPRELVIRTYEDEASRVVISVEDCGIGISAENAAQLFDAFFTTKSNGMGMGLAICRSIAEAHGGQLEASSNVGPGATFTIALPPVSSDA